MMTNELRLWGISSQLWSRKFWGMRRTSAITITGTWSTACAAENSAALQVSAESWNAEPGKHFPTPVTSSCNVTDSAWQSRARHKMSQDVTGCCPGFSPCNAPSVTRVPTMAQFGSLTGSHSANIWRHCAGAIVSLQSWYLPHVSSRWPHSCDLTYIGFWRKKVRVCIMLGKMLLQLLQF